jgi:NTE family protein
VSTPPPHASQVYEPAPESKRSGVGLCLSGGGFRASLFHLGALRRLNELGILAKVDTISAVSGGSIIAAHLAASVGWPLSGRIEDFEERVARPFRHFAARDIRTRPLLKGMLPFVSSVDGLAANYEKHLTAMRLNELPEKPHFVFCATDMAYGCNWIFERDSIGDYQAGYLSPVPDAWKVAQAVAASSCFPPVFNPYAPNIDPKQLRGGRIPHGEERDRCVRKLRLTDGGNYDNMGLEPVWKNHRVVLVSDGGATFDYAGDTNLLGRLLRYTAIIDRQAHSLRKRWLISSFINRVMEGAYWGIGSSVHSYGVTVHGAYHSAVVDEWIASIRTDLDAFSEAEAAILENHGYSLAEAAVRRHLGHLAAPAPIHVPHANWIDERDVRKALARSGKRKLLGRG